MAENKSPVEEKIKDARAEIVYEMIILLGEAYPKQPANPELMVKFANNVEGILKRKLGEVF